MSEWKPIETAPKNGAPILVCGWDFERNQPFNPRSVWWSLIHDEWVVREKEFEATTVRQSRLHWWMPLPEPPASPPISMSVKEEAQEDE